MIINPTVTGQPPGAGGWGPRSTILDAPDSLRLSGQALQASLSDLVYYNFDHLLLNVRLAGGGAGDGGGRRQ